MTKTYLSEALNENTAPERLGELVEKDASRAIHEAIAQNPNTPTYLLLKLFKNFPLEVINNPVIPLLLLENPNFYEEFYLANFSVFEQVRLPNFFRQFIEIKF